MNKQEPKCPETKLTYGYISNKKPDTSLWFNTFEEAVASAKSDQPNYKPYYIVERVECFEICGKVK